MTLPIIPPRVPIRPRGHCHMLHLVVLVAPLLKMQSCMRASTCEEGLSGAEAARVLYIRERPAGALPETRKCPRVGLPNWEVKQVTLSCLMSIGARPVLSLTSAACTGLLRSVSPAAEQRDRVQRKPVTAEQHRSISCNVTCLLSSGPPHPLIHIYISYIPHKSLHLVKGSAHSPGSSFLWI